MLTHYNPIDRFFCRWKLNETMPPIKQNILDSIFYIYPSKKDASDSSEFGGTGFVVMRDSSVNSNVCYLYGITNWHVIDDAGPNPIIRMNTKDGKYRLIETKISDWIRHRDSDDLVAISFSFDETNYKIVPLPMSLALTDKLIMEYDVGVGDEAVMVGRFRSHAGRNKNLPVAMFGYISMMPNEPIYNERIDLDQDSYLIEMRSIPGFSGSPVLLWIPPLSARRKNTSLSLHARWALLGVCWGYVNVPEKAEDINGKTYNLKLNSSMAMVVPSQKIIELIDGDEMKKEREDTEKELQERMESSGFSVSSSKAGDKTVHTRKKFEDALKKAFKPDEEQKSAEGKSKT
ncbi:MAG: serine protease [Anaerolineales bacterium]